MLTDPEVQVRLTCECWTSTEPPPSEFYVVDITNEPSAKEGVPVGKVSFVNLDAYWPLKDPERRWVVKIRVVNAGVKTYLNLRVIVDVEFGKPWRFFADDVSVTRWSEVCCSGFIVLNLEGLAPGEENARAFFVCNRSPLGVKCRSNGSEEKWLFLKPLITDPSQVEKRHQVLKDRDEW